MSEEKKEQQDFLSGHEELLNSINKKSDDVPSEEGAPTAPVEAEEPVAVTEEVPAPAEEVKEAPAEVPEEPAPEKSIEAEEPAAVTEEAPAPVEEVKAAPAEAHEEPAPVVEETVAKEPEPMPEPVVEEVIEETPVAAEVVKEPAPEPEQVIEEPAVEKAPAFEEEEEIVDQKVVAEVPPVVTETPAKPAPKKKKPANHAEAVKQRHAAVEQAEVKEVLNFIMKYVKPVVAVLIIACVLIIGKSVISQSRMKKEATADKALMEARSAADYQDILDNFGKTASAPMALMGLAQEKFNAAAPAEAAELYAEFGKKYPNHEMAAQARFNEISCIEAQQQYDAAATAYGEFRLNNEDSHLAPVALLGKGRCLEAQSKWTEAKQVYEDITAFYEDSGWAQIAESQITVVNSKIK